MVADHKPDGVQQELNDTKPKITHFLTNSIHVETGSRSVQNRLPLTPPSPGAPPYYF